MTNKLPGLRERNRIRTRDEMLIAVSELLGERVLKDVTIDEVAARAGVSRATVYAYFPDGRNQLVSDAYERVAELVAKDGSHRREHEPSLSGKVLGLATALVNAVTTPEGRFYGAVGPEVANVVAGRVSSSSQLFLSLLVEDLRRAVESGELPMQSAAEDVAVLLSGAIREVGKVAALEPTRSADLLAALRRTVEALLT